ncbi:MAG: diacylglycerol kinase family protein [Leptolyngbyaceae cyanobacterium SM2_5_2]|nr:diacylglycerol kinase family protein [Leptolyngbyaceae cyanobacterium SM2_5_2]
MSQELSTETPPHAPKLVKPNRELSWQIASSLVVSFKYAWAGLSYAFQTQRNFRIHTLMTMVALGLGLWISKEMEDGLGWKVG